MLWSCQLLLGTPHLGGSTLLLGFFPLDHTLLQSLFKCHQTWESFPFRIGEFLRLLVAGRFPCQIIFFGMARRGLGGWMSLI
jgi:hypothetical protein